MLLHVTQAVNNPRNVFLHKFLNAVVLCAMIVDKEEKAVIPILRAHSKCPAFTVENLAVGDYLIGIGDELVIERKTWNDLKASIVDTRYKEQKKRLNDSNLNVIFLLEDPRFCDTRVLTDEDVRVCGAFMSLMLSRRWHVLCTRNAHESVEMLIAIENKMQEWKHKQELLGAVQMEQSEITHSRALLFKKNYKTPEDAALAALTCVRGISVKKARIITQAKGSLMQIGQCSIEELAGIECGTGSGAVTKSRKLGPNVAKLIHEMFAAFGIGDGGGKNKMEEVKETEEGAGGVERADGTDGELGEIKDMEEMEGEEGGC